ncbi:MAG: exonuclease domain-containing protein [Elusimicrobiota bacterium]
MSVGSSLELLAVSELDFCVVDTETTGGKAENEHVIDIAAFHYRDGIIFDKFQTLINPGKAIPSWITQLTGISNEMVTNAPTFSEIAIPLAEFLNKGVFVAHNAAFDYSFIKSEYARVGMGWERPKLCTVRMARHLYPELPSRSLGALCDYLMIDLTDRHRAHGDAEATVYVLKHLLKKAEREMGVSNWKSLQILMQGETLVLPKGISTDFILGLPKEKGSYLFKDEKGEIVFHGQTINLQKRLYNLFRKSNQSKRSQRFRENVRAIELI